MNSSPNVSIAGRARSKTFHAIQPSSRTTPSEAAPAIPRKSRSPSGIPRRSSVLPEAAGSVVTLLTARPGRCLGGLDLLQLPEGERLHGGRKRLEEERRAELLAAGDCPVDHLPQV